MRSLPSVTSRHPRSQRPAAVSVNRAAAQVLYAGTTPTFVGLLQVNFQVPVVASAYNPVQLTVGSAANVDTSVFL
jgi:uncharacterized protein (TIGR03437 family)